MMAVSTSLVTRSAAASDMAGFVGDDRQLRHSRPSRSINTSASGGPDNLEG